MTDKGDDEGLVIETESSQWRYLEFSLYRQIARGATHAGNLQCLLATWAKCCRDIHIVNFIKYVCIINNLSQYNN